MVWHKWFGFWALFLFLGIAITLLFFEVLLRMLPVHEGTHRLPVNEGNPILRFEPNRKFIWSKGWNFGMVNEVRTNNFGFINDFDYYEDSRIPLLAVIGDSYVEAMMVPFRQTITGRLAEHLNNTRVYSFGVSGSPLSQYLAYAEYVQRIFQPDGMVIVVVGNDFDESLKKYKSLPGYHYFGETSHGEFRLERVDFSPSFLTKLARFSAVGRYLGINFELQARLKNISSIMASENDYEGFVGNTSSNTDPIRVGDSKRAVDAFFDKLPTASGLSPRKILFIIDGMRPHLYKDKTLELANGSYFDVMRRYFIESAGLKGYEVVDMQPIFLGHYKQNRKRFDYPNDAHWNTLGHELCFDTIARSALLLRF